MTTLAKRLIEAREECGLTQGQLAKAAGVKNQSTIGMLESGERKSSAYIPAIAHALNVEPLWLAEGRGEKRRTELSLSSDTAASLTLAYPDPKTTPAKTIGGDIQIRQFNAGGSMGTGVVLRDQPGVIQSWRVSPEWLQKNVKHHSGAENLCIVTGFGDSMRPMYNPGDPLLVDTGVKSVDFDAVYFFRVGEEGFIKRLQRIPGEGIRAISANKEYETWTIRPDMDFEVFGRVLKLWCSEDF